MKKYKFNCSMLIYKFSLYPATVYYAFQPRSNCNMYILFFFFFGGGGQINKKLTSTKYLFGLYIRCINISQGKDISLSELFSGHYRPLKKVMGPLSSRGREGTGLRLRKYPFRGFPLGQCRINLIS